MSEPSLRELYEAVMLEDRGVSQYLLALLKRLVEAVEPEDTDATIRKLRVERADAGFLVADLRKEMAELRFAKRYWMERCKKARRQPVEAMEPEKHTCGECELFCGHSGCRDKVTEWAALAIHLIKPDTPACEDFVAPKETCTVEPEDIDERDAIIRKLTTGLAEIRGARRYWQGRCEKARSQLAKAKVEIADLKAGRDGWERGCWEAEQELAQAKTEIEQLQQKRDMFEQMWKDTAGILGDAVKAHDKTIAEAQAEIERLRPLAEIGELVEAMRDDSKLCKKDKFYWAEGYFEVPEHDPEYQGAMGYRTHFATPWTYDLVGTLRSIQKVDDDQG